MITLKFTSELVTQLITTGAVHQKTKIIDGVPVGSILTRASVENGVLSLVFGDEPVVNITKAVTVQSYLEPIEPEV